MSSYYDIALSISNQMQDVTVLHSMSCELTTAEHLRLCADFEYNADEDVYTVELYCQLADETYEIISHNQHCHDNLIDIIMQLLHGGFEYTVEEL